MRQLTQFKQVYFPDRPLLTCSVCKKPGYEYIRKRPSGHKYVYTIHYNEPPNRIVNGKPRYRWCYTGGRLYNSFEEAIKVEQEKYEKVAKLVKRPSPKIVNCPRCHSRGRLNVWKDKRNDSISYEVAHENVEGTWGIKKKRSKFRRCRMRLGPEREAAERRIRGQ